MTTKNEEDQRLRSVPLQNANSILVGRKGAEEAQLEIEDRKRAEVLLAGEKRLLEMIARGDSRALILEGACRLLEKLASGSLDPNANCLRHGAAPSLPMTYTEAIDGGLIGPSAGSCGTAAYRAEPVIVSDIATDPLWADYRDLALAHGLRACWSTPILSSAGRVLGTFATYYREPRSPSPQERSVIERVTHLASIAIEREQAEEKLRQSEAYLLKVQADLAHVNRVTTIGELTASIAHEISQPVAAVVANAGVARRLLAKGPPDLDKAGESLEQTLKAGVRAGEIVKRIRALVKKSPLRKDWVDVNKMILEVIELTRSEVLRHNVSLKTRLSTDLPLIWGDRIQLQQVILNLIINALEAMGGLTPAELVVSSQKDGSDSVRVSVLDWGEGLAEGTRDRMFEAFYTTKPNGMGMGLAISRSIISDHGGELWATPNEPRGAVFQFTLPRDGDSPSREA